MSLSDKRAEKIQKLILPILISKTIKKIKSIGNCAPLPLMFGDIAMIEAKIPEMIPNPTKNKCSEISIRIRLALRNPRAVIIESSDLLSMTLLAINIPTPRVPSKRPRPPSALKIDM